MSRNPANVASAPSSASVRSEKHREFIQEAAALFPTKIEMGVLEAADKLLRLACGFSLPISLQWIAAGDRGAVKVASGTESAICSIPNGYFRGLLARLSVLFSKSSPDSEAWNCYGATGRLRIQGSDSTSTPLEMTFENTTRKQYVELRPIPMDDVTGMEFVLSLPSPRTDADFAALTR